MLENHCIDQNASFSIGSSYDPIAADKAVHFSSIFFSGRFFSIVSTIWALMTWLVRHKKNTGNNKKLRHSAIQFRKSLLKLGTTFIKLGQFLSMRPDILPIELIEELSLLQDQVPPMPFADIKLIIQEELNKNINELFQSLEEECIASASIGQVHKAILANGTAVAIKVQRPGLAKVIYQDLGLMRLIARIGNICSRNSNWQAWHDLTDDFGRSLFLEMNYLEEGKHADRIRKILRMMPSVIVPRIIWRLTTKRILTEELCLGKKIDNLMSSLPNNIDLKRISTYLVDAYLLQIFGHGYFHADPHAGNFAVSKNGQLIIYDFGMVSYLNDCQKQGLLNAITSVANNDINSFVNSLEELGIVTQISPESKSDLRKTIQPFLSFCLTSPTSVVELSQLEKEMDRLFKKQSLSLPANLAYLIRAIVSLEGFVRQLNPEFNFIRAAKPYFKPSILKRLAQVSN